MVSRSADQLREKQFAWREIGWGWWVAAVFSYLVAMLLSNLFWYRVLLAMGQQPDPRNCLIAFFTSQLGKYIPGKAMVVVIRTGIIRGEHVQTRAAAASVFVETLTWIFVGSAIASALLIFRFRDQTVLQLVAGALLLAAGSLTWPPVFRAIASRVGGFSQAQARRTFSGLTAKTMMTGWALLTVGWCFNGLSLLWVMYGLPGAAVTPNDFLLALACVTLATAAGFVSLLPGGIGVRELVMIPLLGPVLGAANAIIAAVIIRLVWLVSELLAAGILYGYNRWLFKPPS